MRKNTLEIIIIILFDDVTVWYINIYNIVHTCCLHREVRGDGNSAEYNGSSKLVHSIKIVLGETAHQKIYNTKPI